MATEKVLSRYQDFNDSKDSAQNRSKENAVKPNGSKPSVDELRRRAYEIFKAREDLQKAEAAPLRGCGKG